MLQTILKMLSDHNRLRIVNLIKEDKLCVGEIQTLLGTTQSNTSRHLEKLKTNGLLKYEKDAQRIYYYLDETLPGNYEFFNDLINKDVLNEKQFLVDMKRLNLYKISGLTCDDLRKYDFVFEKLGIGE